MTGPDRGRRVLLVDDDADVRLVLATKLEALGLAVEEAASGEEALDRWRACDPDLVVLDERMEGLRGLEVARRLRDEGFARPLVLYSAYLDDEARREADRAGVHAVSKIEFPALVETVLGLLGRR